MKQILLTEIPAYLEADYQVFDIRPIDALELGSITNSIYLPVDSTTEQLLSLVKDPEHAILCTGDKNQIPDSLQDSFSLYCVLPTNEDISEYLPIDVLIIVDLEEFVLDIKHDKKANIIDVRNSVSFVREHIVSAISVPFPTLDDSIEDIRQLDKIYVVGEHAMEAVSAASILRTYGLINIRAVATTADEWVKAGLPIEKQKGVSTK